MRSYTPNSPESAARVVAMMLLADGHLSMTEMHAVDTLKVSHNLGLAPQHFTRVLENFCHDLQISHPGPWMGSSQLDDEVRKPLLAEITDPDLQTEVMKLCASLIHADGHVADQEIHMLDALAQAWPHRYCAHRLPTPQRAQAVVC